MMGTNVSFPLILEIQNEYYTKNMITDKKKIIEYIIQPIEENVSSL